ncbi:helix-turn-helix domain-containing protein [Mesoterricola silvestris]|uniref:HTH cro/C1-type domain-containing protein n=1 Tax=Mesoterricola silvestris TaxID=2927979 RepID=A0AA48GQC4_9BACT|nr:XRE family transcriptional regulator [Mesoterricola silvestris]BDU74174.1 hypothetical protein METEAL_33480 [Mesoterricola silvestris]
MAITQQELSRRIRAAREASQMTQEEAATQLGVSRPSYVQIEAGNRSVTSLELDRLAYLFGREIRDFLAEAFEEEDALAALFRAQPEVASQPEVLEKLRTCMALGRELTRLEQFLGLDHEKAQVTTYSYPPLRSRWDAIQQGQRLAESERRRLGLGNTSLPEVTELLESQGVRTGLVDLVDDVSGLTLNDRKVGFFVVANRLHHHLRRRFSFVHEYAHVLVDRDKFGLVSKASERDELTEVRANSFAANFLLPESGVRAFIQGLGKGQPSRPSADLFDEAGSLNVEGRNDPGSQALQLYDVVQLAYAFGVSCQSALFRLRNLRFITEREFENLKTQEQAGKAKSIHSFLDLPTPDHEGLRNAFKQRFLGLALEAYRREEISRGKLRELALLMGCPADALDLLSVEAGDVETCEASER